MSNHIKDLEDKLKLLKNHDYDTIDRLMKSIGKKYNVSMKKLHNDFVKKHDQSPDSWIKRLSGKNIKKTKSCGCSMKESTILDELIFNIIENERKRRLWKHENYRKIIEDTNYQEKRTLKEFLEISETKSPAWQRKAGKNPEGGLNKKGIMSYRKENPGSKLSLAVTTKPSKLKKGSKSWKRRKSFCSRMKGMKSKLTSTKTARDPNSRINKSLRKWNC